LHFLLHHVIAARVDFGFEGGLRPQTLVLFLAALFDGLVASLIPPLLALKIFLNAANFANSFFCLLSPFLHELLFCKFRLLFCSLFIGLPGLDLSLALGDNCGVAMLYGSMMLQ